MDLNLQMETELRVREEGKPEEKMGKTEEQDMEKG
jgi:hypothetical protein